MTEDVFQQDVLLAYGRQVSRQPSTKTEVYEIIKAKNRYEQYKRTNHIHGMKKWKKIWNILEKAKTENI